MSKKNPTPDSEKTRLTRARLIYALVQEARGENLKDIAAEVNDFIIAAGMEPVKPDSVRTQMNWLREKYGEVYAVLFQPYPDSLDAEDLVTYILADLFTGYERAKAKGGLSTKDTLAWTQRLLDTIKTLEQVRRTSEFSEDTDIFAELIKKELRARDKD